MTRLDHQVQSVRNRLTIDHFFRAWAQALLNAAAVSLAYVLIRTFTPWQLPHEKWWAWGVLGVTVLAGLITAFRRRPDALAAATAIDDRLRLHEKFSTALHARRSNDPFAHAAVLDAEQVAQTADLRGQFKLHWPRLAGPALALVVAAVAVRYLVPPRNLFASNNTKPGTPTAVTQAEREKAKVAIQQAIAKIDQMPKATADQSAVQNAKAELAEMLKKPDLTPDAGRRKALSALQDLQKATEDAEKTQKFADAKNAERMLEKMAPNTDEKGMVADAQRDLSKGDFNGAVDKLEQTVEQFDKMSDQQKQDAAKQMQQMAKQLQQLANPTPQQQQKQQQQMQQMGMNQQQAQQAQHLMQQAAQGNQQAAQQLQQMAQQAMKQMNGGQGPSQQQMAQAQQMMQQMQGQANNQQQAQQLQQAAVQMSQAMQQAAGQNPQTAAGAKQGQSQQGQQAQQGQTANAQQQPGGQNQQQPGQQPGQQASQGQGQQASGQKPGGQQQQQMQQAMQQMQQQMQQMQAAQQDANQVAGAQQDAADAAQQAQAAMNGQGNNPMDGNPSPNGQNGGKQNQPGGQPGNHAGKGHTASVATNGPDVPFTVDRKTSIGQEDDKGRMLAGSLVKADAPKGESKAALQNAAKSAEQDAADEVDSDRIDKHSQKAVRDYFGSMAQ